MESDKFQAENRQQQELDDAALATNDDAAMAARLKEAWEWYQNSPYSWKNCGLLEKADDLANRLYGEPFSEMDPEEFDEPD